MRLVEERSKPAATSLHVEVSSSHIAAALLAHPCFAELLRDALLPSTQPGAPSPCPPPVCLVCLGLGSVADSRKSQEQFILLQGLVEELEDAVRLRAELPTGLRRLTFRFALQLPGKTAIYDPVFDEQDYEYFMNEGLNALREEVSRLHSANSLDRA